MGFSSLKLVSKRHSRQALYFFGALHSYDPLDSQFVALQGFWREFLDTTNSERIILVEGRVANKEDTFENAVIKYGEAGAIYFLGDSEKIDLVRIEPDDRATRQELCKHNNPKHVAYALIAQYLCSWFRTMRDQTFEEALDLGINRERDYADVYGFELNREVYQEIHQELFSDQPLEDRAFLAHITDPRVDTTIINRIVASRTLYRNRLILEYIQKTWSEGKSIFVVYGRGHLDSLRNDLLALE